MQLKIFLNAKNRISIAYSSFFLGEEIVESSIKSMKNNPKVIMTVFNNFRNDTRVLREAKSLKSMGFDVTVVAVYSTGQKRKEEMEGIRVFRLLLEPFHLRLIRRLKRLPILGPWASNLLRIITQPIHRYLMILEFEKNCLDLFSDSKSDIIHSHDLNTLRLGERLSNAHGSKLVYDSHELYVDRNRKWKAGPLKRALLKRFEKSLVKKCDLVITVNESISKLLSERYSIKNTEVIMNTPPMQFFPRSNHDCDLRTILEIPEKRKIAIYVGSIQRNRGIENLLISLNFLHDVHLVLMGYGDSQLLEELEKIASKNGLSDRFSVYGPVPSELVPQFTSSADVGVAPIMNSCLSYYLCSPNKVFEYMHAESVVASDFQN